MGVQSIAQPTETACPTPSGRHRASGYRRPVAGVPEQAHNVLAVALSTLDAVLVLGLLGQQLLPLHLGLHLGWNVRNDELHDASYHKHHVLEIQDYLSLLSL